MEFLHVVYNLHVIFDASLTASYPDNYNVDCNYNIALFRQELLEAWKKLEI